MNIYRAAERMMAMGDATWLRHANPLSGWTRMAVLPLLALAIWSRVWLGWFAAVPVIAACLWTWWNPRAFRAPDNFEHWMSRGVLGEWVFLRHRDQVEAHQIRAAHVLAAASAPGAIVMIWGLIILWWEGVVFGVILTAIPKLWFVDRMAWIWADWQRSGGGMPGHS